MNRAFTARCLRGQAIVEAAFAIPFMLLCVLGIIYFGRAGYVDQMLTYAAQEGARAAVAIPNLNDQSVRDTVRGFDLAGQPTNPGSVVYTTLGSANLLSNGSTGNLPPGAFIKILPWDADGSMADQTPSGTLAVRIQYPFSLLNNPFAGQRGGQQLSFDFGLASSTPAVRFGDFTMTEKATIAQLIYQGVD